MISQISLTEISSLQLKSFVNDSDLLQNMYSRAVTQCKLINVLNSIRSFSNAFKAHCSNEFQFEAIRWQVCSRSFVTWWPILNALQKLRILFKTLFSLSWLHCVTARKYMFCNKSLSLTNDLRCRLDISVSETWDINAHYVEKLYLCNWFNKSSVYYWERTLDTLYISFQNHLKK